MAAVGQLAAGVQGFASNLFGSYAGYPDGFPTIVMNDRLMVASPHVLATARAFFNCSSLPGAELEDEDPPLIDIPEGGSRCLHWETRIFDVRSRQFLVSSRHPIFFASAAPDISHTIYELFYPARTDCREPLLQPAFVFCLRSDVRMIPAPALHGSRWSTVCKN